MNASRNWLFSALALGLSINTACVSGQSYPSKPVRFVIPQTPSGLVDTMGRTAAQHLAERMGQPWVVENRAGANGIIGTDAIAKAPPDGYNLVMVNQSGLVLNAAIRKSLPYDPVNDFTSIGQLFEFPYYLVIHPGVPARNLQELLALAREHPGKLNYATVGNGSGQHMYMEIFKTLTRTDLTHVPYKGSAQAGTDLIAGQVQVMFQGSTFTLPQAKAGKVRAIATTGSQRLAGLPEVPTVAESGFPTFSASTWYGISGPAKLPRAIVDRLNRELNEFLRAPANREKYIAQDVILLPGSPEALTERVKSEIPVFARVVREAGIEQE